MRHTLLTFCPAPFRAGPVKRWLARTIRPSKCTHPIRTSWLAAYIKSL